MLSCCYFCSDKHHSPCTEYLSSPPLLSFLPTESSCLRPCIFYSFCFILLLQISPLITEVKTISGDPWLFPATFLTKHLTGCISHWCIVSGNHGIDVYVLIRQFDGWCKFPTYGCLKTSCNIWIPQFLKIKP